MTDTAATTSAPWWKTTWPLGRTQWVQLGIALVAVITAFSFVGYLYTDVFAPNVVTELDVEIAESLADDRSEAENDRAHWGAFLADTPVKIGASVLIAAAMLWVWRRWHEVVFMGLTLIFEATAFIITTWIVGRPRPDVERLLESPVNTSFPSGHVAAATVYAALAIIVFWHTRSTVARGVASLLAVMIPLIVGWARLHQGMHFFSDVVAGVVLGIVSVWICYRILGAPHDAEPSPVSTHVLDDGGPR